MRGAYYNEHDPKAAAWLRELIKRNLIAPGEVDERSIEDVRPNELRGYAQCHFFAGIGVWSYALRRAGWPDDRQVWTGSCPCQPFSEAGKGKGFDDERHLWPAWHHLIRVCRPASVLGEQVERQAGRAWFDLVQSDLEGIGYACGPVVLPAASIGAPHPRHRIWFVAHSDNTERRTKESAWHLNDRAAPERNESHGNAWQRLHDADWKDFAGCVRTFPDEPAARMVRLRGYGNAINAEQATEFIKAVMETACP